MDTLNRTQDRAIAASQSQQERKFWLNQLSGAWVKSYIPYDIERIEGDEPGDGSHPARAGKETVEIRLEPGLCARILKISAGSDSRLHMICIAGVILLLQRLTGNNDIIIGIPVDKQEIEGEFINMAVAIRSIVDPSKAFKDMLMEVRKTVLEAAENQNYPLEALLYDLGINADETGISLFDVGVLLENIQDRENLKHLNLNMVFSFLRTGETVSGVIEYNPMRYHESTILQIGRHFCLLLDRVLADVTVKIAEIDILSEEEKKKLVVDFNRTEQDYIGVKTLHGLFREQVEKTPHQPALLHPQQAGGQDLTVSETYKELNEKSNRLAWELKSRGIKPGSTVGIMAVNPITLVTCILGILKAGGTYIPFSLRYPGERIRYMLRDSQARMLIVEREQMVPEPGSTAIEKVDFQELSRAAVVDSELPEIARPTDAAYIIYTSGTTGTPRGVLVEHRSAVNTLVSRREIYRLNPAVTALQLFSPAFDGFITSFFTPIISGAVVVLLTEEDVMDITRVKTALVSNKVSHLISIPSLYQAIIEELSPGEMASLKVVTLAGDRLTPQVLEMTKEKNPDLEITQEYGVTEAAVLSTLFRHQEKESRLKIGRPIANTRVYIIDDYFRLQPIGVPGELCLAGIGVARGYLNNQELTAERFINKSFCGGSRGAVFSKRAPLAARGKIYKTGDLARWLEDGDLEFLGRVDTQVKIMGFRIELGEVENRLLKHKDIKEAVVVPGETANGFKYLCAYLVPVSQDSPFTSTQVREYLEKLLPDYMIPAYCVTMDRIPLTPNGKIDRSRLPQASDLLNTEYAAPRNELEQALAKIWQEELKHRQVGINDNYFTIGGDSIKSVRLVNIINSRLNKQIKIADLYTNNTIAKLAEVLEKSTAGLASDNHEYEKAMDKLDDLKNRFLQGVQENDD